MRIIIETIKNLFRKPFTRSYPDDKVEPEKRFRGKIRFIPEKCTGCNLCVKYCPVGAITLYEKGKLEIDMGKCILCGNCIDVCNFDALEADQSFDYPTREKKELITGKKD
jgi:formate hydrogenlyase subunit 6/NADH:ubiquinone oxidoreductase subunit I